MKKKHFLISFAVLSLICRTMHSATFTVSLTSDTLPVGVSGELRYAINQANTTSGGPHTIQFTTGGTIKLNQILPPLNPQGFPGSVGTINVNGNSPTINGQSYQNLGFQSVWGYPGLIVMSGTIHIQDSTMGGNSLTIENGLVNGGGGGFATLVNLSGLSTYTVPTGNDTHGSAFGSHGAGGGGGLGAGGGLIILPGATVQVDASGTLNVQDCQATGGQGGKGGSVSGSAGGGGLMGSGGAAGQTGSSPGAGGGGGGIWALGGTTQNVAGSTTLPVGGGGGAGSGPGSIPLNNVIGATGTSIQVSSASDGGSNWQGNGGVNSGGGGGGGGGGAWSGSANEGLGGNSIFSGGGGGGGTTNGSADTTGGVGGAAGTNGGTGGTYSASTYAAPGSGTAAGGGGGGAGEYRTSDSPASTPSAGGNGAGSSASPFSPPGGGGGGGGSVLYNSGFSLASSTHYCDGGAGEYGSGGGGGGVFLNTTATTGSYSGGNGGAGGVFGGGGGGGAGYSTTSLAIPGGIGGAGGYGGGGGAGGPSHLGAGGAGGAGGYGGGGGGGGAGSTSGGSGGTSAGLGGAGGAGTTTFGVSGGGGGAGLGGGVFVSNNANFIVNGTLSVSFNQVYPGTGGAANGQNAGHIGFPSNGVTSRLYFNDIFVMSGGTFTANSGSNITTTSPFLADSVFGSANINLSGSTFTTNGNNIFAASLPTGIPYASSININGGTSVTITPGLDHSYFGTNTQLNLGNCTILINTSASTNPFTNSIVTTSSTTATLQGVGGITTPTLVTGVISGNGNLQIGGNGSGNYVELNPATQNTYSGTTTIGSGGLIVGSTKGLNTNTIDLTNQGQLIAGALTLSNPISLSTTSGDLYTLAATTGNTMVLSGQISAGNTTGNMVIGITSPAGFLGTVQFANSSNNYSNPVFVNSGVTLQAGANNCFSGSNITLNGSATLDAQGFTCSAGTLVGTSSTSTAHIGSGGVLQIVANTGNPGFAGLITGAGAIAINGSSGTTYELLDTSNNYTGGTFLNGGKTIIPNGASALSTGALTFNGGALRSAGQTFTQNIVVNSGGGTLSGGGIFSGIISGSSSGTLILSGAGNVQITNTSNTFSGTLNFDNTFLGGTLIVANGASLNALSQITNSGNPTIQATSSTVSLTPNINMGPGLTLDSNNHTLNISGTMSGSGSLFVNLPGGTGTVAFSGTGSTLTGTTTLEGGTLNLTSSALGTSSITMATSGTILQAGGSTTTLGNSVTVQPNTNVTIDANNFLLQLNGTLTASGNTVLTIESSHGSSGMVDLSNGTTALSNFEVLVSNCLVRFKTGTFTTGITALLLNNGTLQASPTSASTINPGAIDITAPATFDSNSSTFTASNAVNGTGPLTIISTGGSSGIVSLNAVNGYSGGTIINSGILSVSADTSLGQTGAGNGLTLGGGTLRFASPFSTARAIALTTGTTSTIDMNGQSSTSTISGNITGTANLNLGTSSGGILTLTGNNTYTGTTNLNGGTIVAGSTTALTSSSSGSLYNFANSANVILTLGAANTIGSLSGGGSTGGTINLGAYVLTIGNDNTSPGAFAGTIASSTSGNGITKIGTGTLTLSGTSTYNGPTTMSKGPITASSTTALSPNSQFVLANDATVVLNLNASNTIGSLTGGGSTGGNVTLGTSVLTIGADNTTPAAYGGAISSSGAGNGITKVGSGTLTLSGTNTYTGTTTIDGGQIAASIPAAIPSSSPFVFANVAGAALTLTGISLTYSIGSVTGGGSLGGNIHLESNLLNIGNDNTTPAAYGGAISSSGAGNGITKVGTGTLTLSGNNTYTGPTTITNGQITATTSTTALSANSAFILANTAGVALNLSASNTIGSLTGGGATGGNVNLGSSILTIGQDNTSPAAYAGAISSTGAGGITKIGTGTLTLSGNNTYSGPTTINNGLLVAASSTALSGSSQYIMANVAGVELVLNASNAIGSLTGGGSSGGNVLLGTNVLTVGNDNTSPAAFGGVISSSGAGNGLVKVGTGTLSLSGTNTFTGNTTISAGTVQLNTSSSSLAGPVIVQSSGTLKGIGTVNNAVTVDGTLHAGNSIGTMHIVGPLTLTSTSTMEVEFVPGVNNDNSVYAVQGNVLLSGTLDFIPNPGLYLGSQIYTFITATSGTISGEFDSIVVGGFPATGIIVPHYGTTTTQLQLDLPIIATTPLTGNREILFNYLTGFVGSSITHVLVDFAFITPAQLTAALDSISPARDAAASFINNQVLPAVGSIVQNRMDEQRMTDRLKHREKQNVLSAIAFKQDLLLAQNENTPSPSRPADYETEDSFQAPRSHPSIGLAGKSRYDFWGTGFGDAIRQNAQNQNPKLRGSVYGGLVGFDYYGFKPAVINVAGGYMNAYTNESNTGSARSNGGMVSAYANANIQKAYVEVGVMTAYNQIKTHRNIEVPGPAPVHATATGSCTDWQLMPHLEAGYDFVFKTGAIEPFISADYVMSFQSAFREAGPSLLNMKIEESRPSLLRIQTGFNRYEAFDTESFTLLFELSFSYVLKKIWGSNNTISLVMAPTFPSAPSPVTLVTYNRTLNLYSGGSQLFFKHKPTGFFASAMYQGEFGSGYMSNNAQGSVGFYY